MTFPVCSRWLATLISASSRSNSTTIVYHYLLCIKQLNLLLPTTNDEYKQFNILLDTNYVRVWVLPDTGTDDQTHNNWEIYIKIQLYETNTGPNQENTYKKCKPNIKSKKLKNAKMILLIIGQYCSIDATNNAKQVNIKTNIQN